MMVAVACRGVEARDSKLQLTQSNGHIAAAGMDVEGFVTESLLTVCVLLFGRRSAKNTTAATAAAVCVKTQKHPTVLVSSSSLRDCTFGLEKLVSKTALRQYVLHMLRGTEIIPVTTNHVLIQNSQNAKKKEEKK